MAGFRFLAPVAVLVALFWFVPAASASHVRCGDVITQDTTLDGDLTCAGDGVLIDNATEVTLDLAGHVIEGTGTGRTRGVANVWPAGLNAIEVRGGTIRGFLFGVEIDGPRGSVLRDLSLQRNEVGISCWYSAGCRISDNLFERNGTGISVEAADAGCSPRDLVARNLIRGNERGIRISGCNTDVVQNRVEDNATHGVVVEDGARVLVARNVVARNGGEGVHAQYLIKVDVIGNRIAGNGSHGVHLDGNGGPYAPGGVVRQNRVVRNGGDGIRTTQVWDSDTVIDANRVERNGDDGIDVDTGEFGRPITVRANRASFNFDLGIEADAGTIDGGGNRALRNGNPAQCIGVKCRKARPARDEQ